MIIHICNDNNDIINAIGIISLELEIVLKNLIAVPTVLIQPVASREVRYLVNQRDFDKCYSIIFRILYFNFISFLCHFLISLSSDICCISESASASLTLYLSHQLLSPSQDSAAQASQQRHLPRCGCKVKMR